MTTETKAKQPGADQTAVRLRLCVWGLRLLVGGTFAFSGLVKAIDPWGFIFKIEEYLAVWHLTEPRSVVLMVAMLPVAKVIVGTSIGNAAMIVMLVIAAAPYVARMVESSLKEVSPGVMEAAQSMGTSDFGIIRKVMIPEAKPALIVGAVISTVTVLGYSAMAATIGGGGLGGIAIIWGHQRSHEDIIWVCVLLIVLIVQVIQELGMLLARKTDRRVRK